MYYLPKKPNRKRTYYKITNKEEKHYRLQYHDGLVIDPIKFNNNPRASCVKGGIYFTTKEHLYKFFYLGKWVRPVTIPKDALVLLDPEGDKYRADRVFLHPRKSMKFYFDNLFNKKTFPEADYYWLAKHCQKYFDTWFDKETYPKEYYYFLATYCQEHYDKWT